jgi:Mor family transcriptional regulator
MSKKLQIAINEHGRPIGEDHHRARLTNGDVDLLLVLREEGWSYRRLAKKFDISKSQVRNIVKGIQRCQFCAGHKTVHLSG